MRRDVVCWSALRARQRPTSQLGWNLDPRDETDPAEAEAAKLIKEIIEDTPRFQKLKMQLLESLWFGKYASELIYRWENHKGRTCLKVVDHIPIMGDKIRFKWDGTPGFLVHANFPGTWEATDWGMAHFLSASERQQYIIHEHEPDDADWTEADMAGSVHGVGLRGRLYWFWWLKQQVLGLLMTYLQRFAMGLTIFYYEAGNPQAEAQATQAATTQFANAAMIYPRWNSENPDVNSIQRLEVGTASPALLEKLVTDYFDSIMVKAILGQTLSSDVGATGLGSGVASLHSHTLDEIIKYDGIDFQETLQTDLVNVLYRWNCPGVRPGKFAFEIDSPNSEEIAKYMDMALSWGLSLDEDQVRKVLQLTKPKPGGGIVTQVPPMGAMPPGAQPQGIPQMGGQPSGQPGMMQQMRRIAQRGRRAEPSSRNDDATVDRLVRNSMRQHQEEMRRHRQGMPV